MYLYTDFNGAQLTARVDPESGTQVGDVVELSFNPAKIHVFDRETGCALG
ncbi:TOBE domain-containing protein [uncultured Faecalibaculum sp.]